MKMSESEHRFHRKTAAQCFNKTWDYLEKKRRNAEDEAMMLHLAHASRYHWSLVGSPRNQAVGDWQTSRVYAALGYASLSLEFAKSSLEIAKRSKLSDVLGTAYEAVARAHVVAMNFRAAKSSSVEPGSSLTHRTLTMMTDRSISVRFVKQRR